MYKLDEFGQMMAASIENAEEWFIYNFAQNGPIEGGIDSACRYLLGVAMSGLDAADFAKQTGISTPVAQRLFQWLENGTKL